jgi:hypothetical protein
LESPKAGVQQQQQFVESVGAEKGNILRQESMEPNALVPFQPASRFPAPLSPKFAIPFGLPSPSSFCNGYHFQFSRARHKYVTPNYALIVVLILAIINIIIILTRRIGFGFALLVVCTQQSFNIC